MKTVHTRGICEHCGKTRLIYGRMLCQTCYHRLRGEGKLYLYSTMFERPKKPPKNLNPITCPSPALCDDCEISKSSEWSGYDICSQSCIRAAPAWDDDWRKSKTQAEENLMQLTHKYYVPARDPRIAWRRQAARMK